MLLPSYKWRKGYSEKRPYPRHQFVVLRCVWVFSAVVWYSMHVLSWFCFVLIQPWGNSFHPSIHSSNLLSNYCNFRLSISILSSWRLGITLQCECFFSSGSSGASSKSKGCLHPSLGSWSTDWTCLYVVTPCLCTWSLLSLKGPYPRCSPPSGITQMSPSHWGLPRLFFLKLALCIFYPLSCFFFFFWLSITIIQHTT